MDTAELLLKACDENPGEAAPVLVLADCEDERGNYESATLLRSGGGFVFAVGGGGGGGGDGGGGVKYKLSRGFAMTDGLYIICSPGGYYPYVRIAWCYRVDGLLHMKNCRVLKQFGNMAELAAIAVDGPKSNTRLLTASEVEYTAIGLISRAIPCDPVNWAYHFKKPKS